MHTPAIASPSSSKDTTTSHVPAPGFSDMRDHPISPVESTSWLPNIAYSATTGRLTVFECAALADVNLLSMLMWLPMSISLIPILSVAHVVVAHDMPLLEVPHLERGAVFRPLGRRGFGTALMVATLASTVFFVVYPMSAIVFVLRVLRPTARGILQDLIPRTLPLVLLWIGLAHVLVKLSLLRAPMLLFLNEPVELLNVPSHDFIAELRAKADSRARTLAVRAGTVGVLMLLSVIIVGVCLWFFVSESELLLLDSRWTFTHSWL